MEMENKDILERNVSQKMCSSGSNGAGEICSPGTADTCGDGGIDVKSQKIKWRKSAENKGFPLRNPVNDLKIKYREDFMKLKRLEYKLSVCRLPAGSPVVPEGEFYVLAKTDE